MRKPIYLLTLLSVLVLAASCQEWDPVLYGLRWEDPIPRADDKLAVTTTIAELKQLYIDNGSKPLEIKDNLVIGGQVISSDRSGNVYRELYIQDDSGAISVKIGKSSLYSDYHPGQWIFVRCKGLTLGSYSGMPQLGVEDETDEYETAYIDAQYLIDEHIVRGRQDEPLKPTSRRPSDWAVSPATNGAASSPSRASATVRRSPATPTSTSASSPSCTLTRTRTRRTSPTVSSSATRPTASRPGPCPRTSSSNTSTRGTSTAPRPATAGR